MDDLTPNEIAALVYAYETKQYQEWSRTAYLAQTVMAVIGSKPPSMEEMIGPPPRRKRLYRDDD